VVAWPSLGHRGKKGTQISKSHLTIPLCTTPSPQVLETEVCVHSSSQEKRLITPPPPLSWIPDHFRRCFFLPGSYEIPEDMCWIKISHYQWPPEATDCNVQGASTPCICNHTSSSVKQVFLPSFVVEDREVWRGDLVSLICGDKQEWETLVLELGPLVHFNLNMSAVQASQSPSQGSSFQKVVPPPIKRTS
jgi:hypothetical protein